VNGCVAIFVWIREYDIGGLGSAEYKIVLIRPVFNDTPSFLYRLYNRPILLASGMQLPYRNETNA